jgi:ComF family protein
MWHWLDFLFPPRVDETALRDVLIDDFLELVAPQLVPETRPSTVTLLSFSDTRVRAAIHEAKYHGNEYAFKLLALALAEYLHYMDDVGLTKSNIIIVPIPLGKERLKERGFNQVTEITSRALHSLDGHLILDTKLLERVKETQSQVSLERRRREENMRGAFRTTRHADSSYTYIVIDDVLTTGATLQAAVDALKEAGAQYIIPLTLAH